MLVRECMTSKVFTIRYDKKLVAARELMDWGTIRHVPVVDDEDRLVGLITHRDLLRASISSCETRLSDMENRQHLWTIPIKKIMISSVHTIEPDANVSDAARVMRDNKIGCLPVLERERLIGILTEFDLLELVIQMGPSSTLMPRFDAILDED